MRTTQESWDSALEKERTKPIGRIDVQTMIRGDTTPYSKFSSHNRLRLLWEIWRRLRRRDKPVVLTLCWYPKHWDES